MIELLFTSFTAAYAQKSQNSDFAHVCLGFITQKQRENTSRRQRVNNNMIEAIIAKDIYNAEICCVCQIFSGKV